MDYITVRQAAIKTKKNEETIKRWIRNGLLPNAIKSSDKEGWRISVPELEEFMINKKLTAKANLLPSKNTSHDDNKTIELAYQVALLRIPSNETIKLLNEVGIKRTLEILLIMRQSINPIKNPHNFIKKAITENWTPQDTHRELTTPQKQRLSDMTQKNYEQLNPHASKSTYYNWLDD